MNKPRLLMPNNLGEDNLKSISKDFCNDLIRDIAQGNVTVISYKFGVLFFRDQSDMSKTPIIRHKKDGFTESILNIIPEKFKNSTLKPLGPGLFLGVKDIRVL